MILYVIEFWWFYEWYDEWHMMDWWMIMIDWWNIYDDNDWFIYYVMIWIILYVNFVFYVVCWFLNYVWFFMNVNYWINWVYI